MRFAKKKLVSLMVTSLLGLSAAAFADDPVPAPASDTAHVTITATVVDNTCEVDTASTTWDFPGNVKVDDIMRDGLTAKKPEKITLNKCGTGVKSVTVSTDNGITDASGLIANQLADASAAKNVAAEILGEDNHSVLTPTSSLIYQLKPGDNNYLDFNVKLKQSGGKPTAGNFKSSVVLNLAYE